MRRSFYLSRPSFGVQFTLRAAGVSCVLRSVLKSNTRAGPTLTRQGGVRFPDRSLNLIGNCVRPEPWLRPPHIRARQSRATKFASALKTCLRTVPGVRAPRAGMRLLSNAFRRGRHYFVARSADQNNAACPRTRWKATSFLPEQVSLPAHLQIRKLFSKKCLHSSRIIGYYLPR